MINKKEKRFENATKELLNIADKLQFKSRIENMRLKSLILHFRDNYKLTEVQKEITKHLEGEFTPLYYPSSGFCKTTKLLYALTGGDKDWNLMYINEGWPFGPHYFLKKKDTGEILDITFDQYSVLDITIPYYLGVSVPLMFDKKNDVALTFAKKLKIDLTGFIMKEKNYKYAS